MSGIEMADNTCIHVEFRLTIAWRRTDRQDIGVGSGKALPRARRSRDNRHPLRRGMSDRHFQQSQIIVKIEVFRFQLIPGPLIDFITPAVDDQIRPRQ